MLKRKKIIIAILIIVTLGIGIYIDRMKINKNNVIMGGEYENNKCDVDSEEVENIDLNYDLERFFRPSKLQIINNRTNSLINDNYNKGIEKIIIPSEFLKTPEDTIINYFSILREAANPKETTNTGCGTLGNAKAPYPVAYNFLASDYKEKLTYKEYINSFENILHINLVKLNKVPSANEDNKYFVELEVIEGSKDKKGLFSYYYGYIYLEESEDGFKIKNMVYYPENYLCAPYHGWRHDAEYFVQVEYGNWCSLVDKSISVEQDGYEKRVYFKDKENNEYYVLFYQLTNGIDLKISDYKKDKDGSWILINIDTDKCLEKHKK